MTNGKEAYREVLKQAKSDRARLIGQLEELENVIRYVERFLSGSALPLEAVSTGVKDASGRFSEMADIQAAEVILQEAGGWMHTKEIAKKVIDGGKDKELKKLRSSLYTTMTRNKKFVKHPEKKATFGLAALASDDHPGRQTFDRRAP